ncbi:MAG: hypothetical protein JXR41_02180 [Bacteroidales bacterium]|nr:hypothetical protein [Bacteroidales bacterium]
MHIKKRRVINKPALLSMIQSSRDPVDLEGSVYNGFQKIKSCQVLRTPED